MKDDGGRRDYTCDTASSALVLCLCVTAFVEAANRIVTTSADHNDGVCDAPDCTLRQVIAVAQAGDTITFAANGNSNGAKRGCLF